MNSIGESPAPSLHYQRLQSLILMQKSNAVKNYCEIIFFVSGRDHCSFIGKGHNKKNATVKSALYPSVHPWPRCCALCISSWGGHGRKVTSCPCSCSPFLQHSHTLSPLSSVPPACQSAVHALLLDFPKCVP